MTERVAAAAREISLICSLCRLRHVPCPVDVLIGRTMLSACNTVTYPLHLLWGTCCMTGAEAAFGPIPLLKVMVFLAQCHALATSA